MLKNVLDQFSEIGNRTKSVLLNERKEDRGGIYLETRPPEVCANIIICLIHQTNYLLDQLLKTLEKDFLEKGGLRENMTKARLARRDELRRGK